MVNLSSAQDVYIRHSQTLSQCCMTETLAYLEGSIIPCPPLEITTT